MWLSGKSLVKQFNFWKVPTVTFQKLVIRFWANTFNHKANNYLASADLLFFIKTIRDVFY